MARYCKLSLDRLLPFAAINFELRALAISGHGTLSGMTKGTLSWWIQTYTSALARIKIIGGPKGLNWILDHWPQGEKPFFQGARGDGTPDATHEKDQGKAPLPTRLSNQLSIIMKYLYMHFLCVALSMWLFGTSISMKNQELLCVDNGAYANARLIWVLHFIS